MSLVLQNTEPSWIRYIKKRIRENKNFLALISGQTGTGKSWSAISIGKMVDPSFNIGRVVFRGKDLMLLVNSDEFKKKKGIFIVWDEAGVDISNRNWQQTANKMINFLLQTFRHRCFILFFTCPYTDFIDAQTRKLFHAEFKTISIDKKNRTTKLKGFLLQYNSELKRFYKKYLKVITKENGVIPVHNWNIPAPDAEFIKLYENKKESFTFDLNKAIMKELSSQDKVDLTEEERKIMLLRDKGLLQREISVELHGNPSYQQNISHILKRIRKKGYILV